MNNDTDKSTRKKSWTADTKTSPQSQKVKLAKFDFEAMKAAATDPDLSVRKRAFLEYYERFQEFPSYLFENSHKIDELLAETVQALLKDADTPPEVLKGVAALLARLPN